MGQMPLRQQVVVLVAMGRQTLLLAYQLITLAVEVAGKLKITAQPPQVGKVVGVLVVTARPEVLR
jgi:hypothetical protein